MAGQSETRLRQSMSKRAIWRALQDHHVAMQGLNLKKLFADDHVRGERLTAEAAGIYFDYSKNRVSDETLKLLVELAEQSGLHARIDAMFRGDKINVTENRAVHTALTEKMSCSLR